MNIKKNVAVSFMLALGFPKAGTWDNDKLKEKLSHVPERVEEDNVPEGYEDTYKEIVKSGGQVEIVEGSATPKAEKPEKAPAKPVEPEEDDPEEDDEDDDEEEATEEPHSITKGTQSEDDDGDEEKPQPEKKTPVKGKSESKKAVEEDEEEGMETVEESLAKGKKPMQRSPFQKPVAPAATTNTAPYPRVVERDAYGCRVGTYSSKVNEAISKKWQTEQEIAEAAGVTLEQARGRLYYATDAGVFERERIIRYRIRPAEANGEKAKAKG